MKLREGKGVIEYLKKRNISRQYKIAKNYFEKDQFKIIDATEINKLAKNEMISSQIEEIIVFRILHHIPEWKKVLKASFDKLPPGGSIYIVEPYRFLSKLADLFLAWQHPEEALFTTAEFEREMRYSGFQTKIVSIGYGFAIRGTVPDKS